MKRNSRRVDAGELEQLRLHHDGPLERCEHCGRIVFRPCLACTLERSGQVHDPFEESREAVDELRLQLQGEDRQRYENLRMKKAAASIRGEADRPRNTRRDCREDGTAEES